MPGYYLGLDIGGSAIKAGVVDDDGAVLSSHREPSVLDEGLEQGLMRLYAAADAVVADAGLTAADLTAVGVAAPGTMNIEAGIVYHPFNLPGWRDLPLARLVADHLHRPTYLQNDANAAAFGEYWVGAAQGVSSLMLWTLGTGIGGGLIVNGQIWTGAHDHAGEAGHMIIQMDGGPRSAFGIDGSPELYSGAKALVRRCQAALESGQPSRLHAMLRENQPLTPLLIAEAAAAGDALAESAIMESARALGVASVSVMHLLNPEMFLLGGAMTFGRHSQPLGRAFLERVKQEIRKRAFPIPAERTIVDYAALGGDAGFIGAAGYARQRSGAAMPRE
jgi:glucokinase